MAAITTRAGKGSPLTNNEVDANFTNLNDELGDTVKSVNGQTPDGSGAVTITVDADPAGTAVALAIALG
jgi:hypothetical protein